MGMVLYIFEACISKIQENVSFGRLPITASNRFPRILPNPTIRRLHKIRVLDELSSNFRANGISSPLYMHHKRRQVP